MTNDTELMERMARALYDCEEQRTIHAAKILSAASGKPVPGMCMEPWAEVREIYVSDAQAVLASLRPTSREAELLISEIKFLRNDVRNADPYESVMVSARVLLRLMDIAEIALALQSTNEATGIADQAASASVLADHVPEASAQSTREKVLEEAARLRIAKARATPYEGIRREGDQYRGGSWVTLRTSDHDALIAALQSPRELEEALRALADELTSLITINDGLDRVKLPSGAWLEGEGATAYITLARTVSEGLRAALSSTEGERETWATIADWCEHTFGPVTPIRIAKRANEEMQELLEKAGSTWTDEAREEAADVIICLARTPDVWAAVERKMVRNRARKWRLTGDGCGYHIPASEPEGEREALSMQGGEEERARIVAYLDGAIEGAFNEAVAADSEDAANHFYSMRDAFVTTLNAIERGDHLPAQQPTVGEESGE